MVETMNTDIDAKVIEASVLKESKASLAALKENVLVQKETKIDLHKSPIKLGYKEVNKEKKNIYR